MKNTSILLGAVLATLIAAGLQANAATTEWTEYQNLGNIEVGNQTYPGTFTQSGLKDGANVYNGLLTADSISAAYVDLTVIDVPKGDYVKLTIGGYSETIYNTSGSVTAYDYTLTPTQDSALQGALSGAADTATISYGVYADCYLQNAKLIVDDITSNTPFTPIPDGGSTMMLLGGVLAGLGLIKRKMA